jgi:molybdopterin-synthase adenylyltransferase
LKPLLLRHYRIRFEPPVDGDGEEELVFTSEGKRLVIRGRSLGLFLERVVPLLDGTHTLAEIEERSADLFDRRQLEESLGLLTDSGIVEDAEASRISPEQRGRLEPQLAYLSEVGADPADVVEMLADSRVTVVGLGALGTVAATALAAANVGSIRCVDGSAVSSADPFLAQLFGLDDVGRPRAEVARDRILAVSSTTSVEIVSGELADDEAVAAAIDGSAFVVCCVDPGLSSIAYKLNRACLAALIPWSSATVTAFEGVVGPTVIPYDTACYLCYQMRAVAARDDPERALEELRELDRSRADGSAHRENTAFGAGIIANLLALEAFKALTGIRSTLAGRILTVDLWGAATKQHTVLRKPWCPDCFAGAAR